MYRRISEDNLVYIRKTNSFHELNEIEIIKNKFYINNIELLPVNTFNFNCFNLALIEKNLYIKSYKKITLNNFEITYNWKLYDSNVDFINCEYEKVSYFKDNLEILIDSKGFNVFEYLWNYIFSFIDKF